MSSPPGNPEHDDDGTVMRPSTPQRPTPATPAPEPPLTTSAPPPVAERTGTGGDPHAPTLSAASLASGVQGVGNALPVGSYLGEFELTQVIGEGGFGIVYLAVDHSLQRRVALKEYMPSSLAERTSGMQVSSLSEEDEETFRKGLDSFINEARLLAQFDHPSLVKVHRFWEANGTAYMVMPFYEGPTLKETLRKLPAPPDEAWLLTLLEPLTEVLAVIHGQQCYHRDIAPDNILLLSGSNRPLLLDFGAARRVIGDANQALTVILKPGYAPVEQYAEVPSMKQGPWTDVYALAAVLFFAITGKKPPAAVGRLLNDQYVPLVQSAAGKYSEAFLRAIDQALVVKPNERTQNIDAFRAALGFGALARDAGGALSVNGGTTASSSYDPTLRGPAASRTPTAAPATPAPPAAAAPGSKKSPAVMVGAAAALLVVAGGAWWVMGSKAPVPSPQGAQAPAPSVAAAAAASVPAVVVPAAPAPPTSPPSSISSISQPFTVVGEFQRVVAGQTAGFGVEARTTKTSLRIGADKLFVSISAVRDGYYYVLSHAPDGQLLQFFPNKDLPSNRIQAGASITLPQKAPDPKTRKVSAEIEITDPPGTGHMLVIVSAYPRDFSALGKGLINQWSEFVTGPQAEALARQAGAGPSIYAGKMLCPAGEACVDNYGAALVDFQIVK